jgi:rRNA large subunit m3Psi methyltransferase RlmH
VDGEITEKDLFPVGTVAKIKQTVKTPEGELRLGCEGFARAKLLSLHHTGDYYSAELILNAEPLDEDLDMHTEALLRAAKSTLEEMGAILPNLAEDMLRGAAQIKLPGAFADFVAANVLVRYEDKLAVLEEFDPVKRLQKTLELMHEETELLLCEMAIHKEVRDRLSRNQKEYYLREQIRVIQEDLGEDGDSEIDEYERRIKEAKLPENPSTGEIQIALEDEAKRILAAMPPRSYRIALCVEGKQFSSEALAKKLDSVLAENGSLCLVIGSSYGLSPKVKEACQLRLSVSELTFPHQMMRVLLLEALYRCFGILKGTKYHK